MLYAASYRCQTGNSTDGYPYYCVLIHVPFLPFTRTPRPLHETTTSIADHNHQHPTFLTSQHSTSLCIPEPSVLGVKQSHNVSVHASVRSLLAHSSSCPSPAVLPWMSQLHWQPTRFPVNSTMHGSAARLWKLPSVAVQVRNIGVQVAALRL